MIDDPAAGVSLQVDAQRHGNHTRFMNHSGTPNVKSSYLFYQGMYHVSMTTVRAVEAHEQLTFHYSQHYWEQLGVVPLDL